MTHDPKVSAYAHRIIHVVDGMVESDEINPPTSRPTDDTPTSPQPSGVLNQKSVYEHFPAVAGVGTPTPALRSRWGCTGVGVPTPATAGKLLNELPIRHTGLPQERLAQFYGDAAARSRRSLAAALLPTTWRTAWALRRHKMRSALSALGVVIAVAAVIAMTEIGEGSKATLQKGIAGMGANTVMIFSGSMSTGGVKLGTSTAVTLTPDDADEIARQCPAVIAVAPIVRARRRSFMATSTGCPTRSAARRRRSWSCAIGRT